MIEYIKRIIADDRSFFAVLLILVSVGSFGLGRQSMVVVQPQSLPIVHTPARIVTAAAVNSGSVEADTQPTPLTTPAFDTTPVTLVGSVNGSKYHRLDCPGAKQIAEKNKVSFDSINAARAAGYTPAANCKGLE